MFDFDEIEDDVSKKGAAAWAEGGKDNARLQEEAARKAEEVVKLAAAKPARVAKGARAPRPPAPAPAEATRVGPAVTEEVEELVGSLRAVVWRPPAPAEGAPARRPAVVICAGNPTRALGSSHMGAPLILALFDAVVMAGFPALRFDYRGVGRNAPEDSEWKAPAPNESAEDAISATRWALERLADRVVIAGYSYGTSMSLAVLMEDIASAFIALSCGTEQWKMFESDPEESARRKEDQVRHSRVTVPALYICGENDWITNQGELRRILDAREDGGATAHVEVIPGVKHELMGLEARAAQLAADWLQAWWQGE